MARVTHLPTPHDRTIWEQLDDNGRLALIVALVACALFGFLLALKITGMLRERDRNFRFRVRNVVNECMTDHMLLHHQDAFARKPA